MNHKSYRHLKGYLKERYGEVVYRIPIDAGFTCPNKDGTKGRGGCIYCDPTGSGFSVDGQKSINEQMSERIEKLRAKGIKKYMAYFQANSNTYAPVKKLRELYDCVISDNIVILDVSTRPDLASEEVLELLESYKEKLDVIIEFGLQTANFRTLEKLNRRHTLAEFIDAVNRAKKHGLEVVAHVIVNLPWDTMADVVETAKILSALDVDGVKMHSLYVVEGTALGKMYEEGLIQICDLDEYIERVITFLEFLDPEIVIHRLVADPPKEGTLFANWGLPKIEIINRIEKKMKEENRHQGGKFSYLNR